MFRFFAPRQGANTRVIRNLPTRKFKQADLMKTKSKTKSLKGELIDVKTDYARVFDNEDDENENAPGCPICMGNYVEGDVLNVLPCGHEFHKECVTKWLPIKKVCPLCRHDVTKKNTATNTPRSNSPINNADNNSAPNENTSNTNYGDDLNNESQHNTIITFQSLDIDDSNNNGVNNHERPREGVTLEQA